MLSDSNGDDDDQAKAIQDSAIKSSNESMEHNECDEKANSAHVNLYEQKFKQIGQTSQQAVDIYYSIESEDEEENFIGGRKGSQVMGPHNVRTKVD